MIDSIRLKEAESLTELNLTDSQKKSGDYQKGVFKWRDLLISIENPTNSIREGVDERGQAWRSKMSCSYGFIQDTIGEDGDEIDIFIGPSIDDFKEIFLISQVDNQSKFDEHKVLLGFKDQKEAESYYLKCYSDDWRGLGRIDTFSEREFLDWISKRGSVVNEVINKDNEVVSKEKSIIKVIKLEGEVFENETLPDLQKQAGDPDNFDILVVEMASPGGSLIEGLSYMAWTENLSLKGKLVVSLITANAYSVVSLMALSANKRLISRSADIMVHNPILPELRYVSATELEKYAVNLRETESIMHSFYERFTGLDLETIKVLMDAETYLDSTRAKELNFVDQIIELEERPKSVISENNNKKEVSMNKTILALNKIVGMMGGQNILNQTYYDKTGGMVEIYQADPSVYKTGDRTSIESGEVELLDGTKLSVSDWVISEINRDSPAEVTAVEVPAVETPATPVAVEEETKTEVTPVEEIKTEVPVAVETTEEVKTEAPVAEAFNEGAAPKEEVKPMAMTPEEQVSFMEKLEAMESRLEELEESFRKSTEGSQKFEDMTVQAIDKIADSFSSGFTPDARQTAKVVEQKSIFKQSLDKRGLGQ